MKNYLPGFSKPKLKKPTPENLFLRGVRGIRIKLSEKEDKNAVSERKKFPQQSIAPEPR